MARQKLTSPSPHKSWLIMSDQNAQTQGGYPPAPQPIRHPNAGCALAATCVAFIFSVLLLSSLVFVRQEQKLVELGGFFSSAKYETVAVVSWLPVIFWTAVFCSVVYALVLWKRSKPFIWLAIGFGLAVRQCADAQKRASTAKSGAAPYQSR